MPVSGSLWFMAATAWGTGKVLILAKGCKAKLRV